MESISSIRDINEINEIMEKYTQIHDIKEIVEENINKVEHLQSNRPTQSGGFVGPLYQAFGQMMSWLMQLIFGFFIWLFRLLRDLFYPLPLPWNKEYGQFYSYIWFCIKAGFYLIIFAIAGPIFTMIGIFMVYGKIFEKMGVSAPELVRERIASAKYT